jgi:hypothetical protein
MLFCEAEYQRGLCFSYELHQCCLALPFGPLTADTGPNLDGTFLDFGNDPTGSGGLLRKRSRSLASNDQAIGGNDTSVPLKPSSASLAENGAP